MRLNQRMWIAFFAAGVVTFSCGFTSLRAQSPAGQDTQQTEAVLEPVDEIMAQDSAATFAVPVVPSAQIHPAGTESQSSSAPAKSRKELKKEAKQMAKAQRKGLIARPDPTVQRYRVEGGVKHQAYRPLRSEIVTVYSTADSLEADSMGITLVQLDSIRYNDRL